MRKPNGYWTYEKCKEVALTCEYRSEVIKKFKSTYKTITTNNWFELFSHMKRLGNKRNRLIYVYEFDDNHCYVGLTGNITRRNIEHIEKDENSSVYKHIVKYNNSYKLILICDYIDVEDAILLEEKTLIEYKNNGWNILNKVKTGSIGLNDKWNKELCEKEAKKYNRIVDFMKNSGGSYEVCRKNNWIDEFFTTREISKVGYWNNKELCEKEAKKYKSRSDFRIALWSAYNYSVINNWIDEFFSIRETSKNGYWNNKKLCEKESKKYKNRGDFKKESWSAYSYSLKNKWLDEFFPIINAYWNNKNLCEKESNKYQTRSNFKKGSRSAYSYSLKNKWLDDFFPKN